MQKENPVCRVSEFRRSFALQIGSIGIGFLLALALAPACSDAAAKDKTGSESDPGRFSWERRSFRLTAA